MVQHQATKHCLSTPGWKNTSHHQPFGDNRFATTTDQAIWCQAQKPYCPTLSWQETWRHQPWSTGLEPPQTGRTYVGQQNAFSQCQVSDNSDDNVKSVSANMPSPKPVQAILTDYEVWNQTNLMTNLGKRNSSPKYKPSELCFHSADNMCQCLARRAKLVDFETSGSKG